MWVPLSGARSCTHLMCVSCPWTWEIIHRQLWSQLQVFLRQEMPDGAMLTVVTLCKGKSKNKTRHADEKEVN